jgi:hypothetical protein
VKSVLFAGTTVLALALSITPTLAKGCLKGAAVGGVAGHVAGHHTVLGAAAGCAVGHHEATKHARENANRAQSMGTSGHADNTSSTTTNSPQ